MFFIWCKEITHKRSFLQELKAFVRSVRWAWASWLLSLIPNWIANVHTAIQLRSLHDLLVISSLERLNQRKGPWVGSKWCMNMNTLWCEKYNKFGVYALGTLASAFQITLVFPHYVSRLLVRSMPYWVQLDTYKNCSFGVSLLQIILLSSVLSQFEQGSQMMM